MGKSPRIAAQMILLIFALSAAAWAEEKPAAAVGIVSLEQLKEAQKLQQEAMSKLLDSTAAPADSADLVQLREEQRGTMDQQVQRAQRLLSNRFVRDFMRLFTSLSFTNDMNAIEASAKKDSKLILYSEIGWFLFIVLLRAKLLSGPGHWLRKLGTRTWTSLLFFSGSSFVIPTFIFGMPYIRITSSVLDVFLNYLKQ